MLTGDDAVAAITIHRVAIVLAVALLVLALMRRLLPAPIALLVACWWAVLPINFDTIYEVHLFSVLPLLGVTLLLTDDPGPWRRGSALALALVGAVLVRNETAILVVLLVAALAVAELRARRRGFATPVRRLVVATAIPLVVALALVGLAHERSIVQGQTARDGWQAKQTLNTCQVYATNYQQRHPEYTENAFLDCENLMQRTFHKPRPTTADAWEANPRAMAAFTVWNAHLLPGGIQLGLFDAVTADDNPDYPPARLGSLYATLLTVVLLALLVLGGRALWRERAVWAPVLRRQRWAWLALGAIAITTLFVVVFNARPRPSYMFGLTAGIMAAAGLALAALVRGRPAERWVAGAAALLPLALIAIVPVHYSDARQPIADQYERLRAVVPDSGPARLVVPAYPGETCAYVVPIGDCKALAYLPEVGAQIAERALSDVLDALGTDAFYADSGVLADPAVGRLVANPERAGWRVASSGRDADGRWVVLVSTRPR